MSAQEATGFPTVDLSPAESNIFEHRLGPETAVHLTTADYLESKASMRYRMQDYVELEIVVSENF